MNAKQEILDALENGERYSFKHMPAHAEDEFSRIRAILPEACWSHPYKCSVSPRQRTGGARDDLP